MSTIWIQMLEQLIFYLFLLIGLLQSATPDTYCTNGVIIIGAVIYCFRSDCPQFGGNGCSGDCCMGVIQSNGIYCDQDGPPTISCMIRETPDPYCKTGEIVISGNIVYCFRSDCAQYGGTGCYPTDCCFGGIQSNGIYCDVTGPQTISCLVRITPDTTCTYGTLINDIYCFRSNCAQYGGTGCYPTDCCFGGIDSNAIYCDITGPPTVSCKLVTNSPTKIPTFSPTLPSMAPSMTSLAPSMTSSSPSTSPTQSPSMSPSMAPTLYPSIAPSISPTNAPSNIPTSPPTAIPSISPTNAPSNIPTSPPTAIPTNAPTVPPTFPEGQVGANNNVYQSTEIEGYNDEVSVQRSVLLELDVKYMILIGIVVAVIIFICALILFFYKRQKKIKGNVERMKSLSSTGNIEMETTEIVSEKEGNCDTTNNNLTPNVMGCIKSGNDGEFESESDDNSKQEMYNDVTPNGVAPSLQNVMCENIEASEDSNDSNDSDGEELFNANVTTLQ